MSDLKLSAMAAMVLIAGGPPYRPMLRDAVLPVEPIPDEISFKTVIIDEAPEITERSLRELRRRHPAQRISEISLSYQTETVDNDRLEAALAKRDRRARRLAKAQRNGGIW